MSDEFMRFERKDVFAVREDQDGRHSEFISQPFKLVVWYRWSGPVFFRLSFSITDNTPTESIVYLQITPERIDSFSPTICNTSDQSTPPCLDRVSRQMGGMRCVTRLQFKLHPDMYPQIIVPTDFTLDKLADSPAQHTFRSAISVAAASLFSLYIPHNVWRLKKFKKLAQAVKSFPKTIQDKEYERLVNLSRLYHGTGGIEYTFDGQKRDRQRSLTPATNKSSDTTVPFDTPRYLDSPPRYEACLHDGQQSGIRLVKAVSAESPGGDCALPEYGDTKWKPNVPRAPERVLQCGSEDTDLYPSYKRKLPFATVCPTTDAQRPEKVWRPEPEYQRLEIERLQEHVKELQRRNKELERRLDEMEEKCCDLENCQVENKETFEHLFIDVDEHAETHERLEKQMSDTRDEVEDLVKESMGKWLEENMAETIKGYINEQVEAKIAKMKKDMRRALLE